MNSKPAIFLDRDGTLIEEKHYLSDPNQVFFYPDVAESLFALKQAGFSLFVITNQSGVAKRLFKEEIVAEIFQKMNQLLLSNQVQLDDQFYCPHRPTGGYPPYDIICDCRKPKPGMIEQAIQKYDIDMSHSFMLGDKLCDVEVAQNVEIPGILLKTGHGMEEVAKVEQKFPHAPIFDNFRAATQYILDLSKK